MSEYLRAEEVADALNMDIFNLYYHLREGNMKSQKVGKSYKIKLEDVVEFITKTGREIEL
jgi:excisionase family DNA binding protein